MRTVFRHFGIGRSEYVNPHSGKRARVFGDINLPVDHQVFVESEIPSVDRASCRFVPQVGIMTNHARRSRPTLREVVCSVGIFDVTQFLRAICGYIANPDIFGFNYGVVNVDWFDRRQNVVKTFKIRIRFFCVRFWNLNDFRFLPFASLYFLTVFFRDVI